MGCKFEKGLIGAKLSEQWEIVGVLEIFCGERESEEIDEKKRERRGEKREKGGRERTVGEISVSAMVKEVEKSPNLNDLIINLANIPKEAILCATASAY